MIHIHSDSVPLDFRSHPFDTLRIRLTSNQYSFKPMSTRYSSIQTMIDSILLDPSSYGTNTFRSRFILIQYSWNPVSRHLPLTAPARSSVESKVVIQLLLYDAALLSSNTAGFSSTLSTGSQPTSSGLSPGNRSSNENIQTFYSITVDPILLVQQDQFTASKNQVNLDSITSTYSPQRTSTHTSHEKVDLLPSSVIGLFLSNIVDLLSSNVFGLSSSNIVGLLIKYLWLALIQCCRFALIQYRRLDCLKHCWLAPLKHCRLAFRIT